MSSLYIGMNFVEQAWQHAQTVILQLGAQGVTEPECLRRILTGILQDLFVHKTVREHFICTRSREDFANFSLHFKTWVLRGRFHTAFWQLTRELIEPIQPPNFLNNIFGQFNIGPPERRGDKQRVFVTLCWIRGKVCAAQESSYLPRFEREPQARIYKRVTHCYFATE